MLNKIIPSIVAGIVGGALVLVLARADQSTTATSPALADDLGPASALVLAGEPEVRLQAKEGRLAWGDEGGARALTIAAVNTGKVLNAILKSDRFVEEQEKFKADAEEKGKAFNDRYKAFEEQFKDVKPSDDKAAEAQAAMGALQQDYQIYMTQLRQAEGAFSAQQYTTAYKEMREAVEVISDRRKIDLVYRFIPPDEEIAPADQTTLTLQLQSRTFIKLPEGIDLTADVLKELNLTAG
ncbi:MAG: OmpH family outer membrane protein [Planctomycetota bacterium]|nr:OmpH family outer membrane protein [Planctomycetota bacterium]